MQFLKYQVFIRCRGHAPLHFYCGRGYVPIHFYLFLVCVFSQVQGIRPHTHIVFFAILFYAQVRGVRPTALLLLLLYLFLQLPWEGVPGGNSGIQIKLPG